MTQVLSPAMTQPFYSSVYVPDLQSIGLTDAERAIISRLQMKAWRNREWMLVTDSYYRGMQIITNLGIAVPPELDFLRVIVGWPKVAVDPFVERLALDSFRLSDSITADPTLMDVVAANGLESELSLGFSEALIMSRSFLTVSSGDDPKNDPPRVCVESPLNVSVNYDLTGRTPREALLSWWADNRRHATLMLPDQTIEVAENDQGGWELVNRDVHNFGMLPLIRMANRPRAGNRDGSSEITPELMSQVDQACRTQLNMAVAGEFYSVPQKLILGATEDAFVDKDGMQMTAWQTYISRILALERDEDGQLPQVHQFAAMDPAVFTKPLEYHAAQVAGMLGANPQDLGLYTDGNPVSAEALNVIEARRDRRTKRSMQPHFGASLVQMGQMVMRFLNDGDLPAGYDRLVADWTDPAMVNFAGAADGWSKLSAEGIVPRKSEVILRKIGLSALERRQIAAEREDGDEQAQEVLDQIGTSVEGKAIRAANAVANATKGLAPAPQTPSA